MPTRPGSEGRAIPLGRWLEEQIKSKWSSLDFRKRVLFYLILLVGLLSVALTAACLGLYVTYSKPHSRFSSAWLGINSVDHIIVNITLLFIVVDYYLECRRGRRPVFGGVRFLKKALHRGENGDSLEKATPSGQAPEAGTQPTSVSILRRALCISVVCLNLFAMVSTIIVFVNYSQLFISRPDVGVYRFGFGLEVIGFISIGAIVAFTVLITIYMFWPVVMISQVVLLICSVLQFLVTTITILINMGVVVLIDSPNRPRYDVHYIQFYPHLSLLLACTAFCGAGIAVSVGMRNRLSTTMVSMIQYYLIISSQSLILCVVWFALAVSQVADDSVADTLPEVFIINPILAGVGVHLTIICMYTAARFMKRPPTKLKVEEYDILSLTPSQLDSWAQLLDLYSKQTVPGSPSGREVLDLMRAYVASPMAKMKCKVLRVYDEKVRNREQEKYYEQVKAWDSLDTSTLFHDLHKVHSTATGATLVNDSNSQEAGEKMSKNQLKRAQRKAQKKQQKGNAKSDILSPVVNNTSSKSPEELKRDLKFHNELMETEALLLFSCVDDYDVSSTMTNRVGKLIQRYLGAGSMWKLLCVRMGLLATHWPFRQSTFYTSPTKKPNARSVAILQAIAKWNDGLPRNERSTLVFDPIYAHNGQESLFTPSGWLSTPVPASHVVDLRTFKDKTLPEYLKAIKYRNQATTFKNAKGEVIETTEFSRENCETIIALWHNIADKRAAEGHPPVLVEPTVEFIMSLGSPENNTHGYRRLLFLKVEGEVIASCVLFVLGDTLTSDIQGLNHEKGRNYKAYFVMMQETIAIALREGISFVDFGPTTSKPKMDIGAVEVPLVGGIYAKPPLSYMIRLFGRQLDGG